MKFTKSNINVLFLLVQKEEYFPLKNCDKMKQFNGEVGSMKEFIEIFQKGYIRSVAGALVQAFGS